MAQIRVIHPTVTQAELRTLVGMRNQIRQLTKQYDSACEMVLRKLLDGADVEAGVHSAELEETIAGSSHVEQLKIY